MNDLERVQGGLRDTAPMGDRAIDCRDDGTFGPDARMRAIVTAHGGVRGRLGAHLGHPG